jgi:ACS family sodium-dependent inorganic phosphate cotransporter
MSVAIIPMAQDFGWSPTTSGLVQSAFFAGYALTQVPGGYQAAKRGGAAVLPLGVALWSAATAAVPLAAGTGALPLLLLCRAAVGAGEGVASSSATDMIARATPPAERARTVSFVFGGLHMGSLVGLLAAPPLIDALGWRAVFYGFGGVGLLWCAWWRSVLEGVARDEPRARARLAHAAGEVTNDDGTTSSSSSEDEAEDARVPWRAFLRNGPYRALAATHFANNWLHYVLMAWLPTYFRDTLSLSLDQAAAVSLLPPAAALAVASAAGPLADALLEAGVPLVTARKAAQAAAFLPPAAALVAAGTLARGDGPATVALVAAALGLSSFSLAGLYCNHADLSPRYAPLLLGGTTAVGAVPGVVGVAATGFLLDASGGDWELALFAPTSALLVLGTVVFTLWGSAEEQDWEADDGPLWIETAWEKLVKGEGGGGEGGEKGE